MRQVVRLAGLVVVLGFSACSSSDSGSGNTGGAGGSAGSTSTGGTAGVGGLSGAGGIGGTGGAAAYGGSSGTSGAGGADAGRTDGGVACGVIVYSDNAACQGWMDQYCCAEEQACGVACRAIVACVNACPAPRTDTCIGACVPQNGGTALDEMDVIANCSKFAPPPSGQSCPWPK